MEYDGHDELKFRWIEQNPELINLIKQNYSVIEHMEISGGEPTILKEFFEIIDGEKRRKHVLSQYPPRSAGEIFGKNVNPTNWKYA